MRDVPIRRIEAGHWEFRFLDAYSNMYLALAGILGSGLDGVARASPLPCKDSGVSPARLDEAGYKSYSIEKKLPGTPSASLNEMESSQALGKILGSN